MKGILGRKVGMTGVFQTDGKLIPVTVIEVESNIITDIKTVDKNGYDAIQLGAFNKREKLSNKAEMGHVKKAATMPKRFLKEIRGVDVSAYAVGQVIGIDTFEAGEIVDVTGTSKGKGFAGVTKRWNQHRGPETHGSTYHRRVGSMGPMRPMRVLKGKKLPGHLGNETVTIQNLEIISIDTENNCILVKGNVPGPKKSLVLVRTAVKGTEKRTAVELVSYETENIEETLTDEVVSTEENIEVSEISNEEAVETTEEISEISEDSKINEEEILESESSEKKEATQVIEETTETTEEEIKEETENTKEVAETSDEESKKEAE